MDYTETLKGLFKDNDKESAIKLMRSNSLPKENSDKINNKKQKSALGNSGKSASSVNSVIILGVLTVSAFLLFKNSIEK